MKNHHFQDLIKLWTHSSDALIILDHKTNFLYANSAVDRVSGLGLKMHVGRSIHDFLNAGFINNAASLKAIKHKRIVTSEVETSAGKKIVSTASPVMDNSGNIYRIVLNIGGTSRAQNGEVMHKEKKQVESFFINDDLACPYNIIKLDSGRQELVYASPQMNKVVEMAYRLTGVDSTVLITGETGVGKELITRLIHNNSVRSRFGNLVKINCAAIPRDLMESELFGYEPGSFTGASKFGKPGYLEMANGGTLFLDEIAEIPLEVQSKLLGVLQDKEYYKVGSIKPSAADVRIIAATNRDLDKMVENETFRQDLYYRLHVIPIEVPPLRERKQDIPVLIAYFCKRLSAKFGIMKEIDPEIINQLYNYDWPGNVRELESLIERILITVPERHITLSSLPKPYSIKTNNNARTLKERVEQFELELVRAELEQARDKDEAAKNLGISVSSLFRKIKLLGS